MPRWIQVGEVTFGAKGQGKTQRVTVTLPEDMAETLLRESTERQTTVSGVVREAVAEYFANREPEGLPEFVGMLEGEDPTLSERVEEIIANDFSDPDFDRG